MRLEPGRVVGEQRVGGGVRLVEAVARELGHLVEDFAGGGLRELALGGALEENLALLLHLGGVFFTHGAAQQVGAASE